MTAPTGYDRLMADETPLGIPTALDVTILLTDTRRFRRALQAHADQIKEHRAAELSVEIANQMEEVTQNVTGQLYQLDKAIGLIERVQSAARDYPEIVMRMEKKVVTVRAR